MFLTGELVPEATLADLAGRYRVLGTKSVIVEWRLGDGSTLRLIANFGAEPIDAAEINESGRTLYGSGDAPGAPQSATFVLTPP